MVNQVILVGELLEHDEEKQEITIRANEHVVTCNYGEGLEQHMPAEGEQIGIKAEIRENNEIFIQKLTYLTMEMDNNGKKVQ